MKVRWVHSEAQLANSLTKWNGGHELELFYRLRSCWRNVEDPDMKSARRRCQPLQQQTDTSQEAHFLSENQNNSDDEMFSPY